MQVELTRHNIGYRAGRVRAIFALPHHLRSWYSEPLVYLDLFSRFSTSRTPFHGMHTTSHDLDDVRRRRSIVLPLSDVVAACHLAPQLKHFKAANPFRPYDDYLSTAQHFFFNHYSNHFIFGLVEHWRAVKAARYQARSSAHQQAS